MTALEAQFGQLFSHYLQPPVNNTPLSQYHAGFEHNAKRPKSALPRNFFSGD
jgi:hypothetical protein